MKEAGCKVYYWTHTYSPGLRHTCQPDPLELPQKTMNHLHCCQTKCRPMSAMDFNFPRGQTNGKKKLHICGFWKQKTESQTQHNSHSLASLLILKIASVLSTLQKQLRGVLVQNLTAEWDATHHLCTSLETKRGWVGGLYILLSLST